MGDPHQAEAETQQQDAELGGRVRGCLHGEAPGRVVDGPNVGIANQQREYGFVQLMIAKSQYQMTAADLEVTLALVRGGTLAGAVNASGSTLPPCSARCSAWSEAWGAHSLSARVPAMSRANWPRSWRRMPSRWRRPWRARASIEAAPSQISGTVRITTTDTLLHGLIAPALLGLRAEHPLLGFELHTGNELASLTRRDADIALRATKRPPQHLVGKPIGAIRVAVYAARRTSLRRAMQNTLATVDWIAPDDALPEHPSVIWRKRNFPSSCRATASTAS